MSEIRLVGRCDLSRRRRKISARRIVTLIEMVRVMVMMMVILLIPLDSCVLGVLDVRLIEKVFVIVRRHITAVLRNDRRI